MVPESRSSPGRCPGSSRHRAQVRVGTPARCMRDAGTFTIPRWADHPTYRSARGDTERTSPCHPTRDPQPASSETLWHSPRWRRCRRSPRSPTATVTVTTANRDSSAGPSCRSTRSPRDRRRARPSRPPTGSRSRCRRSLSRASRPSSMGAGRASYLAMPDNGYGGKATSGDFLIRAYYIRPDFKTAQGGTGDVEVGRVHPVPRSRRSDRLPDRQRGRRRIAS